MRVSAMLGPGKVSKSGYADTKPPPGMRAKRARLTRFCVYFGWKMLGFGAILRALGRSATRTRSTTLPTTRFRAVLLD